MFPIIISSLLENSKKNSKIALPLKIMVIFVLAVIFSMIRVGGKILKLEKDDSLNKSISSIGASTDIAHAQDCGCTGGDSETYAGKIARGCGGGCSTTNCTTDPPGPSTTAACVFSTTIHRPPGPPPPCTTAPCGCGSTTPCTTVTTAPTTATTGTTVTTGTTSPPSVDDISIEQQ